MHDLVIKGAILVDGMGNPATKGEVAVSGGKIVAIFVELFTVLSKVAADMFPGGRPRLSHG